MNITQRIRAVQSELENRNAYALIIPSTDPHMSEYVAPRWEGRAWISGFHGSAGTAVVTLDGAALWTDGRYFLEAGEVLAGTGIELMKMGLPDTPEIEEWIAARHKKRAGASDQVLVSAESFPQAMFSAMAARLVRYGLKLIAGIDPLEAVWKDRPALPARPFYETSSKHTGETRSRRLERLRLWLADRPEDFVLVTALDEIAWLLNLRGSDVECNPVFYAYLLVSPDEASLFTHGEDMSREIAAGLEADGISVLPYAGFITELEKIEGKVCADPGTINMAAAQALGDGFAPAESPVKLWKAVKTTVELESTRTVMERDGAAMVRLLHWIEKRVENREPLDEMMISGKISEIRRAGEGYIGDSFPAIVGFGAHGAIVHYRVNETSSLPVEQNGMLLIDSGGQYADGTTDITRTLGIHDVSQSQIDHFTLVLKGNIALSQAVFPRGTSGLQLDVLARQGLWSRGLNYAHGTGHGVGFALNVHEGPQSISTRFIKQELLPGMIVSNEPGYYVEGSHGIRIENLEAVVEHPELSGFLMFETLTLCPIELELINSSLLTSDELAWLNQYHQTVWRRLSPLLDSELRLWLQHKTRKL